VKYEDLSPDAQECARDWWTECEQQEWDGSDCYDELKEVLEAFGFDLATHNVRLTNGKNKTEPDFEWQISYSQGDGFAFHGWWRAEDMTKLPELLVDRPTDTVLARAAADIMVVFLRYPNARVCFDEQRRIGEAWADNGGGFNDDDALPDADARAVMEVAHDLARWCYEYLRADLEWRLGEENVVEAITANEYEFDEDGYPLTRPA
jgi:hypothetical protein